MGAMTIVEVIDAHNGFALVQITYPDNESLPDCFGSLASSPSSSVPFSTT